jgi:hypothetical protein
MIIILKKLKKILEIDRLYKIMWFYTVIKAEVAVLKIIILITIKINKKNKQKFLNLNSFYFIKFTLHFYCKFLRNCYIMKALYEVKYVIIKLKNFN